MENYLNSDNNSIIMAYADGYTETWLNNKTGWNQSGLFILPSGNDVYFVDSTGADKGLRLEDINSDGFPDLIQGWGVGKKTWLNNKL